MINQVAEMRQFVRALETNYDTKAPIEFKLRMQGAVHTQLDHYETILGMMNKPYRALSYEYIPTDAALASHQGGDAALNKVGTYVEVRGTTATDYSSGSGSEGSRSASPTNEGTAVDA
jgi:hypothetical protein